MPKLKELDPTSKAVHLQNIWRNPPPKKKNFGCFFFLYANLAKAHHLISTTAAQDEWAGRSIVGERSEMFLLQTISWLVQRCHIMYTSNNLTPGKVDWENTSMTKTRENSMNFYCTFVSLRKCDVLLSIAIDQPKKSSYHSRSQHLPQQFMPCLPLGRTYQVWNLACKHLKHV